jgi:hypothetical protein
VHCVSDCKAASREAARRPPAGSRAEGASPDPHTSNSGHTSIPSTVQLDHMDACGVRGPGRTPVRHVDGAAHKRRIFSYAPEVLGFLRYASTVFDGE